MTDPYGSKVREFHEAFGLKIRDTPEVGSADERVLRVRLMLEEVLEFAKAARVVVHAPVGAMSGMSGVGVYVAGEPDLAAMAHELADVAYVTHGTAVQFGFSMLEVYAEVHAANMRKLGADGKPAVDERGKVKKPEGWRPADVGAVLKRLSGGEG